MVFKAALRYLKEFKT